MPHETRTLLTIVTESVLETPLCNDLKEIGATGYTITDARGRGSRGRRDAGWSTSSNIRLEVICDEATSEKIIACVQDKYYENYAMVLFIGDVKVLRPEKF